MEFSDDGETFDTKKRLSMICTDEEETRRFCDDRIEYWTYIRTCPETHAHPTVTIGGVELPRPETEPLEGNQIYFTFDCLKQNRMFTHTWCNDQYDKRWLRHGIVHLTEPRAKAWASWWENTVMAAVRGGSE